MSKFKKGDIVKLSRSKYNLVVEVVRHYQPDLFVGKVIVDDDPVIRARWEIGSQQDGLFYSEFELFKPGQSKIWRLLNTEKML